MDLALAGCSGSVGVNGVACALSFGRGALAVEARTLCAARLYGVARGVPRLTDL